MDMTILPEMARGGKRGFRVRPSGLVVCKISKFRKQLPRYLHKSK